MKILCLNGINLNMFGKRDPAQYGTVTLAEIDAQVKKLGQGHSAVLGWVTLAKHVQVDAVQTQNLHDRPLRWG